MNRHARPHTTITGVSPEARRPTENETALGWVLRQQSYFRAVGGLLVVTEHADYHVVDRGILMTRHVVPIDRIAGFTVRLGTSADHKQMSADWMVLEFLDEAAPVRIACSQSEMRYVEHAVNRTLNLPRS